MDANKKNDLLVQYKAYMDNLNAIGTQHSQTRAFYVSVISALLVFLSFVGSGKSSVERISYPGQLAVISLGIILCTAWYIHTRSFGKLYRAKFDILRQMEKDLAFNTFEKELEKLYEYKYFFFTAIESMISLFVAIPFVILLIFL